MVPDVATRHLEAPLLLVHLGSCGADLKPALYSAVGHQQVDDKHVAVFLAEAHGLKEHVAANKTLSLNANRPGVNECYQLKGPCVSIEPPSPAHLERWQQCRDNFVDQLSQMGYPKETLTAFFARPEVVVTMEVVEVYVQTPGPEAGKRIAPPEAV